MKNAGIRTGAEYLEGLRDNREIWPRGARVKDVTAKPGIQGGTASLAGFLDRQHEETYHDKVTFLDKDSIRCATSHMVPKSKTDVLQRGRAFYEWATWSNGMFGRTPDYKNASVMAFAHAPRFLSQGTVGQANFVQNMTNFYDEVQLNDKVLTHTLVNPSVSHAQFASGKFDQEVALHVVKETDAGIIVKVARPLATLGPLADEIEDFPSAVLKADPSNIPFAFAIPIATTGLKMLCRDTYDHERSHFDAPLSSRYEEMDAVVIFDNVLVPW
jgi:4-hydroxyphenylacetate 3-monooxygenase